MQLEVIIAFGGVVCLVGVWAVKMISSQKGGSKSQAYAQVIPAAVTAPPVVSEELEEKLRQLLREGKDIEACVMLRQVTGCSLRQAKDIMNSISKNKSLSTSNFQKESTSGMPSELVKEVCQLLEDGKKIEAIKLYREKTGVGLKEAHAEIERLQS